MKIKYILFLSSFLIITAMNDIHATDRIGNIYLEKRDVFDTTKYQFKFVEQIANFLHIQTCDYVIEDELLFAPGDDYNDDLIYETERNLRNLGIFSQVKIEFDSVNSVTSDIIVNTQDNWSTRLSALFGSGGRENTYGARVEEINLIGTNTKFKIEGLYRTENNIQWQGQGLLENRRLFRTPIGAKFSIFSNKYRTEQAAAVYKEFGSLSSKFAFSLSAINKFGNEFIYKHGENIKDENLQMYSNEQFVSLYLSRAWRNIDRVFVSTLFEYHKVDREFDEYRRAYDNMGRFLIAFSSAAEDYVPMTGVNGYTVEDVPIGGWGSAILGRVFPMGNGGTNPMYYVAGQAERSYLSDKQDLYLFGQISASTCFSESTPANTYQEFLGLGFYKLSPKMILAGRFRQQNVWNWQNNYRQLLLDNENGIRGYRLNELRGDNRIYSNIELRWMPNIPFWFFNFGMNAFYDCGSVWNRNTALAKTQWHHSLGLGLRFYNDKGGDNASCFRIDFAYNFDEKKIAEIVFSTNQFFSAFGLHTFEAPRLFGTDNDLD